MITLKHLLKGAQWSKHPEKRAKHPPVPRPDDTYDVLRKYPGPLVPTRFVGDQTTFLTPLDVISVTTATGNTTDTMSGTSFLPVAGTMDTTISDIKAWEARVHHTSG